MTSGVMCLTTTANKLAGSFSGDGAGLTNLPSLWRIAGNSGTAPGSDFLGTTDSKALELKVNSTRALRLEPGIENLFNSGAPNLIGGSSVNFVTANNVGATIGGGGAVNYSGFGYTNSVTDSFGTVAGGAQNTSSGFSATVGGGKQNTSSGYAATVGGGFGNTSSRTRATGGGGQQNTSSRDYTPGGGGEGKNSSGNDATGGGGIQKTRSEGGWGV